MSDRRARRMALCAVSAGLALLGLAMVQAAEEELVIGASDMPFHPGCRWEYQIELSGQEGPKRTAVVVDGPMRVGDEDYAVCKVIFEGQIVITSYERRDGPRVLSYAALDPATRPSIPVRFPLRVGDNWRDDGQEFRGGKVFDQGSEYRVLRAETVEVPAGKFRCLVLRHEMLADGVVIDKWAAPGVGYVKLEARKKDGQTPEYVSVLTRFEQKVSPDEKAIRDLVDKINRAYAAKDAELLREVLSEKAFAFALPRPAAPRLALVFDRDAFCRALAQHFRSRPPRLHEHRMLSVTVVGPMAYEVGETTDVAFDGTERLYGIVNVFAKDEAGWRMVFSVPAPDITEALSGSAADEFAVRKLAREWVAAWRTEDATPARRVGGMLDEEFVSVSSTGRLTAGKEANLRLWRESMAEIRDVFNEWTLTFEVRSVKLFAGGAIVTGLVTMDGRLKDGDAPFHRYVWETLVFRREGAAWRLVQEHAARVPSPEGD